MSSIWLNWDEAQGGDLPMVCATCGDDATELVERRLSSVRPGLMCIVRTRVTVHLPYCRRHVVASWNGFLRVRAKSIGKDGITLGQVADDFVDAVEEYRDHPERYRRRRRAAAGRRAHDDGHEEEPPPPRPRRTNDASHTLYAILMTVLLVVCIGSCGFGLLIFNLLRSGGPAANQPQPGFHRPLGPNVPGAPRPPFRR